MTLSRQKVVSCESERGLDIMEPISLPSAERPANVNKVMARFGHSPIFGLHDIDHALPQVYNVRVIIVPCKR
jgi:hypothetical protein